MIETYLLEQFAAFARFGTLLKASEELHITQPTLSRSMKKLEEELGVSIFHRENSKLSLNETGKVAAEYAKKALQANQDLISPSGQSGSDRPCTGTRPEPQDRQYRVELSIPDQ